MPIFLLIFAVIAAFQFESALAGQLDSDKKKEVPASAASTFEIFKHKSYLVVKYSLRTKLGRLTEGKALIRVSKEFYESPFYDASGITFFNDAVPAIEVTGACGNKVCEKLVYRFDATTRGYRLFFHGGYSRISIFDGYLIEEGPSGCCAFEYHAYKMPGRGGVISAPPQVIIEVAGAPEKPVAEGVECMFTDLNGSSMDPPNHGWLRFCQVYGGPFRLRK